MGAPGVAGGPEGGKQVVLRAQPAEDGRIESKRVSDFVAHCQRVTEGQLLEIHAQTWKYNQLLADQRIIIDERRAKLLDTDQAWQELSQRAPERAAELTEVPEEARIKAELEAGESAKQAYWEGQDLPGDEAKIVPDLPADTRPAAQSDKASGGAMKWLLLGAVVVAGAAGAVVFLL